MRKLQLLLTFVTLMAVGYLWQLPSSVLAANELTSCILTPGGGTTFTYSPGAGSGIGDVLGPESIIPLTFSTGFSSSQSSAKLEDYYNMSSFEIAICKGTCPGFGYTYYHLSSGQITRTGNQFTVRLPASEYQEGEFRAVLRARELGKSENSDVCPEVVPAFKVVKSGNIPPLNNCSSSMNFTPNPIPAGATTFTVTFNAASLNDAAEYWIEYDENNVTDGVGSERFTKSGTGLLGHSSRRASLNAPTTRSGDIITATFPMRSITNGGALLLRGTTINSSFAALYTACTKTITYDPTTGNAGETTNLVGIQSFAVCNQIAPGPQKDTCEACYPEGIWTAVGCIETNAKSIVTQIIQIGLGLSGGVALLMIIAAGFLLSTSQNDPKKVTDAKEMVTSAVIGLLFIVFSVTILQFIGVTVLKIPGFGT